MSEDFPVPLCPERHVVCGDAESAVPDHCQANALGLHLYGADDERKLTLKIDEIRQHLYRDVPVRFHDLLDIATYVYAADQLTRRGARDADTFGSHWRRRFCFWIPVRDLEFWQSEPVQACLRKTLDFLSDDHYRFEFSRIRQKAQFQTLLQFQEPDGSQPGFPEQVVMFSGGLDSLGGAVEEAVRQKRRIVLVNHRSTQKLDQRYLRLRTLLEQRTPYNPPFHIRVSVHKKRWMNREPTQRSRSFLFMALGATIATMLNHSQFRFYENGVLSLNLPICAQVVGSKATRTTHPRVIRDFEELLTLIGEQPFQVETPFFWNTKAEVVKLIAQEGCAEWIADSISCTHTWEMTREHSHCGYCSQCLDRRLAIIAAGLEDYDPLAQYGMDIFTQSRSRRQHVNEDKLLFASYLERAREVTQVEGPLRFLRSYPEVSRALSYLSGDASANLQRCYDLYQRHATEVNRAVVTMLSRHGDGIFQRRFPPDALLPIVYETGPSGCGPVSPALGEELPPNIFRRRGGAWQVRFRGQRDFTVLPYRGADYLHLLLSHPGELLATVDVVCGAAAEHCSYLLSAHEAVEAGLQSRHHPLLETLGDISDWPAVGQYREEAQRLLAKIARARADRDEAQVRELEGEMILIVAQITEAVRWGGKLKQAGDKRKNIRDGFRNNVNRVIDRQIEPTDAALAEHLRKCIAFGNEVRYQPDEDPHWELEPIVNE